MPRRKNTSHAAEGAATAPSVRMLERRLKLLKQWLETERAAIELQDFLEPRRARLKAPRNRAKEAATARSQSKFDRDLIKLLRS